jgi:DNA-directed RNA polymerase subunit L
MYPYLRTYTEDVENRWLRTKFKSNRGTRRGEDHTMQNFIVDILKKY